MLLRSLSSLAAARSAEPNSPGRCSTATTSPPIGARCTCASNTDRKMLMRGNGIAGKPSSAGGTASSMRQIKPSAGATTRTGRVGGTRDGYRKNAALAAAEASAARRSHLLWQAAAATARLIPTNGRPSRCIGGTAERTSATSRAGPVLRSGRLAIVQRFYGRAFRPIGLCQVPDAHRRACGDLGDVLVDLPQAVGRGQPAQMVRGRGAVAGDGARVAVQHAAAELALTPRRGQILGKHGRAPWPIGIR